MAGGALLLLAGWTLFAFGGAYHWTTIPLVVGAAVLAVIERPAILRGPDRLLDAALLACLLAGVAQLVPLTAPLRFALSPGAVAVDQALRVGEPRNPLDAVPRALSVDPTATGWAIASGAAFVLFFWSARAILTRGGIRVVARGVAWLGFLLSALVLVQHATAPTRLYWYWQPASKGATPLGPFVNRNDLATWVMMAIPLTLGYAITRIESRRRKAGAAVNIESVVDPVTLSLVMSVCLMLAALLVSLSRSGLTGGIVALACFLGLSGRRAATRGRTWLALALAAMVAAAISYANPGAIATRLSETLVVGVGGRAAIWRDTWSMLRDFWPTGIGVGAYERAMLVYQQGPRLFYYNHAHNEYLQLAVEGGLLLLIPAAIALGAAIARVARRLWDDQSPLFWIRAGAASAVAGLAVQSVWETGLRMPANAVLLAMIAAVAVHDPDPSRERGSVAAAQGLPLGKRSTQSAQRSRKANRVLRVLSGLQRLTSGVRV